MGEDIVDPTPAKTGLKENISIPEFARNLFPTNFVLSAAELCELSKIIQEANASALDLELLPIDNDEDQNEKADRIRKLMKVEYEFSASHGDHILGFGCPVVEDFPDRLSSFFISNSAFAKRVVNQSPLNHVNAYLSFSTPSLKLDLITLPSNPTENRSVINVVGKNENWVRATAEKLEEFFQKKKTLRPVIHGSGAYDLLLFGLYLPVIIGLLAKFDEQILLWINEKSIILNAIIAIYVFFLALLFGRLLFQTIRWLLPPTEYFKSSRTTATVARFAIGALIVSISTAALYDFFKHVIALIF
jgi:hypothetical protein